MRFFNIDLHVSVIEDMATQFEALGHAVESHLMSGHAWTLGRQRASRGVFPNTVGYGSLNEHNWEGFFRGGPDFKNAKLWQEENKHLDEFDGFISTYPPAFFLLYEGFRGKNIVNIPVRYDLCFVPDAELMFEANRRLVEGVERGKTVVVANSVYDARYYEYFTGQKCRHISSTCDYVDRFAPKWSGTESHFYAFGERAACAAAQNRTPLVKDVRQHLGERYHYADIPKARGIVWFPYTTSIMSFFEHYWLGIPLFVPSKKFLLELFDRKLALSSFSWHDKPLDGSILPPAGTYMPDPHTRKGVESWLDTYDFYNESEFPYVTYFDSGEHLQYIVETTSRESLTVTSYSMNAHNSKRRERNLAAWKEVLT